tara:strand:- start:496 stop:936 length:441 start_codon:yes stop_codon:yes gene_type:complete
LLSKEKELLEGNKKTINKHMIKDFLIINCTGKDNLVGLRVHNNFYIHKIQNSINKKDALTGNIIDFLKKNNTNIDKNFSIIVNCGPGSFSVIRTSLAVAKGIRISKGSKLYGYNNSLLTEFNLKNIEILIEKNLLENKLIKPVYLS